MTRQAVSCRQRACDERMIFKRRPKMSAKKPGKQSADKKERLAEALRANLQRRKSQARGRKAGPKKSNEQSEDGAN